MSHAHLTFNLMYLAGLHYPAIYCNTMAIGAKT